MDSSMIGKIEKAMFYAQEPERIQFDKFTAIVQGTHRLHTVNYNHGQWTCGCKFYNQHKICSHIMAIERILAGCVTPADVSYSMNSSIIGKIEKAIFYAQERERITFKSFEASVQGDHKQHNVTYHEGVWTCDCSYFHSRGVCSHVMAMERLLMDSVVTAEAIPLPA